MEQFKTECFDIGKSGFILFVELGYSLVLTYAIKRNNRQETGNHLK